MDVKFLENDGKGLMNSPWGRLQMIVSNVNPNKEVML